MSETSQPQREEATEGEHDGATRQSTRGPRPQTRQPTKRTTTMATTGVSSSLPMTATS